MKTDILDEPSTYDGHEATIPRGWSAWFGGPRVRIGPRIAPHVVPLSIDSHESDSGLSSDAILNKQLEEEANCAIQYRTCSWQKVRPKTTRNPKAGAKNRSFAYLLTPWLLSL